MQFPYRISAFDVFCADNTTLDSGSGGDTIRTEDRTTYKTPVSLIDVGGTSAEALIGDSGVAMPVRGLSAHDAAVSGNPVLIGAEFDDTTPDSVDEGDIGRLRISANRNLMVTVRDAAGNERGLNVDASGNIGVTDASGALTVDNGGTFAVQESGAALTALQLIDDAVYTDGTGTPSKAIGVAGTDGTNPQIIKTDSAGELQIDVLTIAAGDNNIGNVDIVTVPAPLSTTGGGTEATALRVTVATDSTGVVSVDDNGAALTVDNGGTFAVQVDGSALTALQLIDNPVLVDDAVFTPATSSVMMAGFEADETGTDSVDEGDAGAGRMTLDRKQIVTIQPHTAGGLSMSSAIGAANTNATVVKASAGQVYEIVVTNHNAAQVYLKLYNKATTPDENDTPVWRMHIPGNAAGAGLAKTFPNGLLFSTGIAYRLVGGIADNSTTATSASEQLINIGYK